MPPLGGNERALVNALDEPALVVDGTLVTAANVPARRLFGQAVEGRDVRLAIRHPQALELILFHSSGELDATGIAEPGRTWRLIIRKLWPHAVLVRMIDCSAIVSAEKMRVDFVANASHELRTPLSTVLGYAETLAEETNLPAELCTNFGRTIRDEARRMLRIIEDLMSLSRIEADRFVTPSDLVDIAAVIETATANAEALRSARSCNFNLHLEKGLPRVRGDLGQVGQVLDNLISNAVRYGCEGPGSIIDISAKRDGAWLVMDVSDHGGGISEEHLPRLTERFYRVDDGRSRQFGGTGLGLAIVKHIIERHRGALHIRSTRGVGTTVTVKLPVAT